MLLSKAPSTKNITLVQKNKILDGVEKMSDSDRGLVYAIIKSYHLRDSKIKKVSGSLPYEGIISQNTVNFDLGVLPNKLKHMIIEFVNLQ
jgi:hypothetical protein